MTGLLVDEGDLELFDGSGYGPDPLTEDELARIRPLDDADQPVRLDYPDFLHASLQSSLGDDLEPSLRVLQTRAPVHLRVNTLRCSVAEAVVALEQDEIETTLLPQPSTALMVTKNHRRVAGSAAYRRGLVELQDAASQIAADASNATPGMTVLDFCAGGGGKTLALGASMKGQGRLLAFDHYPARMKGLPDRAKRAGVRVNCLDRRELPRVLGACDLVFVDAPCSGTGAWRRTPDAKWRLSPRGLEDLIAMQKRIFSEALGYLRPKGRLVYATCSLLRSENQEVVESQLNDHPELQCLNQTRLLPAVEHDGFFFAELELR